MFNGTMFQGVKFRVDSTNSQVCSLRFDLFHKEFNFGSIWFVFVNNFVLNASMFQGVKFRIDSTNYQVCSLWFDLFHEGFWFWLNLVNNSVFNGTMFQGVEFWVDSTNSEVCSLWFNLFHEGFWFWINSLCLSQQHTSPGSFGAICCVFFLQTPVAPASTNPAIHRLGNSGTTTHDVRIRRSAFLVV